MIVSKGWFKGICAFVVGSMLGVLLLSSTPFPKPKTKGQYFNFAGITSQGKVCNVDSANGLVMRIDQDHENPLFQSKLPNRIHLLIWFKQGIDFSKRLQMPSPQVEVCYWEAGDLLMFHSTKATGWMDFTDGSVGTRIEGKMELKLVEPDHNMSNSDYHYMGGGFTLAPSKL